MSVKIRMIKILLLAAALLTLLPAGQTWAQALPAPEKGVLVTLSAYSGRPNPQWWITDQDQLGRLAELIKSAKPSPEKSFDYNKWNRLGFASFWLNNKGLEGMPKKVHVWRDQAVIVTGQKDAPPLYANEALPLYDMLVKQAEEHDQHNFFRNYHKWRKDQPTVK